MSEKSIEEYKEFYEKIKKELDESIPSSELNSDRLHNAAIMKLMLESSSNISMFCGSLSVFRPQFYELMAELHGADTAALARLEVAKALSEFLADSTRHLNVILEYSDEFDYSMILDKEIIRAAISDGTMSVYSLNSKFLWGNSLNHFAFSDDSEMLRLEEDKIEHTGLYVTREKSVLKKAHDTYEMLKLRSKKIA